MVVDESVQARVSLESINDDLAQHAREPSSRELADTVDVGRFWAAVMITNGHIGSQSRTSSRDETRCGLGAFGEYQMPRNNCEAFSVFA